MQKKKTTTVGKAICAFLHHKKKKTKFSGTVHERRRAAIGSLCDQDDGCVVVAVVVVSVWQQISLAFILLHLLLCYANRLNDLEYRRAAHDKDEQGQQPRSDRVLFLGVLGRFGHVATHRDVLAGLLVGNADSLLRGHLSVFCCEVFSAVNTARGKGGRYNISMVGMVYAMRGDHLPKSGNVLCVAEALQFQQQQAGRLWIVTVWKKSRQARNRNTSVNVVKMENSNVSMLMGRETRHTHPDDSIAPTFTRVHQTPWLQ